MRLALGIALTVLAGCAAPPARESSPGAAAAGLERLTAGNPMCLGVEFLPPFDGDLALAVPSRTARAEIVREPPRPQPAPPKYRPYGGREPSLGHTWTMSADDLAAVRNPMVRETLQFIDDVMGEDRRRLLRNLGTPILRMQTIDLQSPGIDLGADELRAEEQARWMAENGTALLRRPLQKLLRRTALVRGLEFELDAFKEDNVPLSEEYGNAHRSTDLGRVSMRLHAGDLQDPVELAYMHSGVRVSSSQDRVKMRFSRQVADDVFLEVRTRHDFDDGDWGVRADLRWTLSPQTNLHFVAGDDLDFLATSSVYSLFESPMDGSPGLLVYAVHIF
ncbi:MAG: hypothetical protein AB7O97_21080 [Planctomycetota bacterium]